MLELLIERTPEGTYTILDFHSLLPAEVLLGKDIVYTGAFLDEKGLWDACRGLYLSLPVLESPVQDSIKEGIIFWRKESEQDKVINAVVVETGRLTELYQQLCARGFLENQVIEWLRSIDRVLHP